MDRHQCCGTNRGGIASVPELPANFPSDEKQAFPALQTPKTCQSTRVGAFVLQSGSVRDCPTFLMFKGLLSTSRGSTPCSQTRGPMAIIDLESSEHVLYNSSLDASAPQGIMQKH